MTAQKRTQDIKDVPSSISALSEDSLKEQGITTYEDITRAVPGISFTAGGSEGMSSIEMRGVSSTSGSATVGIYMDEVPLTVTNSPTSGSSYSGNTEIKLFDLERVEVLRGPQGTLYGASSMGGTLRFITHTPDLNTFSSNASVDLSGTEFAGFNQTASAVVNVPVAPGVFALRAGVQYEYEPGYIDNYTLAGTLNREGTNDERSYAIRLAGKYQPSEALTISPSVFLQQDTTGDASTFYPDYGLWKQNKQIVENGRDRLAVAGITVNAALPFADFTSVTSYFWRDHFRVTDGTYYNSTVLATAILDPVYPQYQQQNDALIAHLPSASPFDITHHRISQELRLSSQTAPDSRMPLKWTAGLYFEDYWDTRKNPPDPPETIPGLNAVFQSIYGFPISDSLIGDGDPDLFANDQIWTEYIRTYQRQYAAFGQLDLDVLPTLHASFGLRKLYAHASEFRLGSGFFNLGTANPFYEDSSYQATTPRFSLLYDVTPDASVYGTIAKGYRLGGPTGPTPQGPGNVCEATGDYATYGIVSPPTQYDSDSLWSYELGTKTRTLDSRLSVNGSIYYIKWSNIQQTILLPTCGFAFTANVGDAESYGAELEVLYKPVSGLTLGLNGGGGRAVITDSSNPLTAAVGQHILGVPEWTADASGRYEWPLRSGVDAFVRMDYNLVGPSYGSYQVDNSDYHNPHYAVLNASIGVEVGSTEVRLYGTNLSDDRTIIQRPQVNEVIEGYTLRPLTIGVAASAKF